MWCGESFFCDDCVMGDVNEVVFTKINTVLGSFTKLVSSVQSLHGCYLCSFHQDNNIVLRSYGKLVSS